MTGSLGWRTVDIVVTAAIAVAFGVVYWAWGLVYSAVGPAFAFFPPAQNIIDGVWLIAGVLAGLIVRKPGAALFAELVAASVEALLGGQWGLDTLLSGAVQGFGAELVFAIARYRVWDLRTAMAAAALSAVAGWLHDVPVYYLDLAPGDWLVLLVIYVISAVILAGVGSWWLYNALVSSGVLSQFASGRMQTRV
ncbi:MAG TPA: ECF transporter S component [Candidatus Acidoferrales bacterium]|nr:ECF transporter S component [Candidatus Acidoferrales bacterium]